MIVTQFGPQAHKLQELPELWLGRDVYLHGLKSSTLRNLELCSTFFKFLEGMMQILDMLLIILTSDN